VARPARPGAAQRSKTRESFLTHRGRPYEQALASGFEPATIATAAIPAAGALVAGLFVDERMSARVLVPPLHHGCARPIEEER
jgi:hypothetical protein